MRNVWLTGLEGPPSLDPTMSRLPLDIVDVFAESKLSGNPLAVVREAGQLPGEVMQAVAREMNFSETTFVVSAAEDRARVRIFTPSQELPFAGHPTLGTAWVLGRERGGFTLELDAGDVDVEFRDGIAWMRPPALRLEETYRSEKVAGWLGIEPSRIVGDPLPQRGDIGLEFLFVGFERLEDLESLDLTLEQLRALPSFGLFAFAACPSDREGPQPPDYRARMFFESGGLREDPATGSANSLFAAYLAQSRGRDISLVVDQGVEMGRPSRIHLVVEAGEIRIGGRVQHVVEGVCLPD